MVVCYKPVVLICFSILFLLIWKSFNKFRLFNFVSALRYINFANLGLWGWLCNVDKLDNNRLIHLIYSFSLLQSFFKRWIALQFTNDSSLVWGSQTQFLQINKYVHIFKIVHTLLPPSLREVALRMQRRKEWLIF